MHYYQKNIGDYRRDTMHLSPLEHGVYNLFIDSYYLHEHPLCADHVELMRSHCLRSAEEVRAGENVLKDYFELTEQGYAHKRCDLEIEAFHGKSSSASKSAKARWDKVRCERNANALQTQSEGNANHKPLTINQEPKKPPRASAPPPPDFSLPDWIDPAQWALWLQTRKGKKMTPAQMQANIDKLARWRTAGVDHCGALADAAAGGWQGLHEPKAKQFAQSTQPAPPLHVKHRCAHPDCTMPGNTSTSGGWACNDHASQVSRAGLRWVEGMT